VEVVEDAVVKVGGVNSVGLMRFFYSDQSDYFLYVNVNQYRVE
jgi:hypothetical protein